MLAFARVALLRLARDRTNVFFVGIFPLLIVLLVGLQFGGGGGTTLAVVAGDATLTAELTTALEAGGAAVVTDLDVDAARGAVEDGDVDAAVVVPAVAPDLTGPSAPVGFVANPDGSDIAARQLVQAAVADVAGTRSSTRLLVAAGADPEQAEELVGDGGDTRVALRTSTVGEEGLAAEFAGLGQFDLGASTQLLLFVFLTAMTGSVGVVQARRWGVLGRVLAGPTSPAAVIAGLGLGQLAVAGLQAVVIVVATRLLFGVDWGDPLASGAVVVLFSLVGAVAGLLLGTLLDNEEQVGGVAVPASLVLAALGGCMVPLEIFPDGLRSFASVTPHAWGNEAFAEIIRRDGGLVDVLPQLGVLLGFAVVLGAAAAVRLHRRLAAGT